MSNVHLQNREGRAPTFLAACWVLWSLEAPAQTGVHAPCGLNIAAKGLFKASVEVRLVTELYGAPELHADPGVVAVLAGVLPRVYAVAVIGAQIPCKFMVQGHPCVVGCTLHLSQECTAADARGLPAHFTFGIHQ